MTVDEVSTTLSHERRRRKPRAPRPAVNLDPAMYTAYAPSDSANDVPPSALLSHQIAACLRDTISALDLLKRAHRAYRELETTQTMRSADMMTRFKEGAEEVRKAWTVAPVLREREKLVELFERKRFLATSVAAKEAAVVVKESQRWLRGVIKEIGADLVRARSEMNGGSCFA